MTLSARMTYAAGHAESLGLTKQDILRKLDAAGLGCARQTLQNYLKGRKGSRPTVDFILEFSRICGVHWEWLIGGEGPRTREEELHAHGPPGGPGLPERMRAALVKHFPIYNRLHRGESGMIWEAVTAYWRWIDLNREVGHATVQDLSDAAEKVAEAINAPLVALDLGEVPEERMIMYITLTSSAFLSLLPPEIRRDTYREEPDLDDGQTNDPG